LISDDDVDQVGSTSAPFVATNEQSPHSVTMESDARVEDNYDMLGRMTKTGTMAADEHQSMGM